MPTHITDVARSVPFDNSSNGFTASEVQSAIEEASNSANAARFTITLINNSSLSNGQRFTFSELLPNTQIIVPFTSQLKAVAFSNSSANADWSFEFFKYTVASNYASSTSLFTWANNNTRLATRNDRSDSFDAGDEIRVIFTDTGVNPSDAAMVLFFQAVP